MKSSFLKQSVFFNYSNDNLNTDFYTIAIGHERCSKNKKKIGPLAKNHYIIHYCTHGKGYFKIKNTWHEITAGDMFIIPPEVKVEYVQDKTDPWVYFWFEYNGALAKVLSDKAFFNEDNPTYRPISHEIRKMLYEMCSSLDGINDGLISVGYIYLIFSILIRERTPSGEKNQANNKNYIKKIISFIEANYSNPELTLSYIAKNFYLNESYLSTVFKKQTGVVMNKYILDYRMQKARLLLNNRTLSINTIAESVGFKDLSYFFKCFRKSFYTTPTAYRKSLEIND